MKLANAASVMKILREVDLGRIQREAARRFALLLAGDPVLTTPLAEALSGAGDGAGMHPWLTLQAPAAVDGVDRFDLALLIQSGLEPDDADRALLERLDRAGVPAVTVVVDPRAGSVTGAELPRPYERARVLLEDPAAEGLESRLAPALLEAAPGELGMSLARQLPPLRPAFARRLIEATARANALYSASTGLAGIVPVLNVPLGLADTVVLTKNQLVMAFKLALAGGKEGRPGELMGEIGGVLGGGLLFRQVARGLVGLIPVAGILPNIAVSYAGTRVIGQAVALWVAEGRRLEPGELRRSYQRALAAGRVLAGTLAEQGRLLAKNRRRGPKAETRALPSPEASGALPPPEERG